MTYLWVGIAGAMGSILRYFIGITLLANSIFPFATLTVNLIGSFILAWLTAAFFKRISISPMVASAIGTGFVGSFTTFSTLSVETIGMFNKGYILLGVIYVATSIVGGIFMGRLGFIIGKEQREV